VVHALENIDPRIRDSVMSSVDALLKNDPYTVTTFAAAAVALRSGKIESIKAGPIFEAIEKTSDDDQLKALIQVHDAVAARLKPEDAYAVASQIVEAFKRITITSQIRTFVRTLEPVASGLKPEDAYALARPIVDAMKSGTTLTLVQALPAIAPQLRPEDAYALGNQITEAIRSQIVEAIKGTESQLNALAKALETVAPQLKPEDAYAVAGPIVEAFKRTTNPP